MKTKNPQHPMLLSNQALSGVLAALGLAALFVAPSVIAVSQTWTNTPPDSAWNNTNNWGGRALPGGINLTGNTVNNDVATFNSPIPGSNVGGVGNPILTDDATTVN